jgi:hypothetical protein
MDPISLALGGASVLSGLFGSRSARKDAKRAARAQAAMQQQVMTQANRAMDVQTGLGREQLDFARQQYADMMPMRNEVVGLQLQSQQQQAGQAQDYYDYMRGVYRPVETRMAAEAAMTNTDAYRERMAQEASQRAALAFQGSQGMATRELARRGLDPTSGAYGAMTNANAINSAAMQATGANQARAQAEQFGYQRNMDVAKMGSYLPAATASAYGGALDAGTTAMNSYMAPTGLYYEGAKLGTGMINQGFDQGMRAYSGMLGGATDTATRASENYYGALGSNTGMLGTFAAASYGANNVPRAGLTGTPRNSVGPMATPYGGYRGYNSGVSNNFNVPNFRP